MYVRLDSFSWSKKILKIYYDLLILIGHCYTYFNIPSSLIQDYEPYPKPWVYEYK